MPPEDPTPNAAAPGEPAPSPAQDASSESSAAAAASPAGAAAPLSETSGFRSLGLPETMLRTLDTLGYEAPSPIQARTIPLLLTGRDILGQAQTGTGKTAAFALPVLARIDLAQRRPQAIVLTPTRELAIQVAEAFQRYAAGMPGFHVLPIYGGQSYPIQLRGLDRGVHVVVGTPGRLMDHLRRGSLDLKNVKYVVLDEADEMLRMGFLDDVTWILDQTPPERQTALFSATMPPPVRRIAQKQMHDPVEITIESRKATADLIRQRFWIVSGTHKLDALTRILEAEDVDGMLVFVRTKTMTTDLAERLEARGFACAPLSGDVPQAVRERTVDRFKSGGLDVLIATDVAARGLDVERVSHVVNFDVPTDTESYVHRIGRTGRAGRRGDAILFVAPRERHMLHAIERTVGRRIEPMALPTTEQVNEQRISRFKERIAEALESEEDLATYSEIVADFVEEHEVEPLAVAAALARMVQGDKPLLFGDGGRSESRGDARPARPAPRQEAYVAPAAPAATSIAPAATSIAPAAAAASAPDVAASADVAAEAAAETSAPATAATPTSPAPSAPAPDEERETPRSFRSPPRPAREFTPEPPFDARRDSAREGWRPEPRREERFERPMRQDPNFDSPRPQRAPDEGLETFRIEVGLADGVRPANIVGAIANEAGIEGRRIGRIELYDDHATVDLPIGMPDDLLAHLGTVRICGRELRMTRAPQVRRHAGGWGGRNAGPPVNREGGRPPFRGGAPGDRRGPGGPGGPGGPRGPGGPGGPGFRRGPPRDDRDGGFEHRGPPRRW